MEEFEEHHYGPWILLTYPITSVDFILSDIQQSKEFSRADIITFQYNLEC